MQIQLLDSSSVIDHRSYADLLRKCRSLNEGKKLHRNLVEAGRAGNTFLDNLVIQMYGKCGSLKDARNAFDTLRKRNVYSWTIMFAAYVENGRLHQARDVFDSMPSGLKNVVSWNAMVSAYAQAGLCAQALQIFRFMDLEGVPPNEITFMSVLDACSGVRDLRQGRIIHRLIDSTDVRVCTALVDMYGKCGSLQHAKNLFDNMPEKNVVSWNAMMAAYAQNGHCREAINLFRLMSLEGVKPDDANFVSVLDACADCGELVEGRLIHSRVVEAGYERDLLVATSLLSMYSSCGDLQLAKRTFDRVEKRDLVAWTALLAAYAKNGCVNEAFAVFQTMDLEGLKLDEACYVGVLEVCAAASTSLLGRLVHGSLVDDTTFLDSSIQVGNAVIHMYGRCGRLKQAREVFEDLRRRDVVSWNAMITAYATNGEVEETMDLFLRMGLEGLPANAITFISVLSACSHSGKLSDALYYFASMNLDYGVGALKDHFVCVVDLLGRMGQLSSCKTHGDREAAGRAAEQMLKLDPENSAPYILLSNAKSPLEAAQEQKIH